MDFTQAYLAIVKASIEKNTKEIPTILSCLDFKNKICLEIGGGPLARLAKKISNFAKHITILEKYPQTIKAIKSIIKKQKLEKKIKEFDLKGNFILSLVRITFIFFSNFCCLIIDFIALIV
jgi:predicted methyltransferase